MLRAGSGDRLLTRLLSRHPAISAPWETQEAGLTFLRSRERRVTPAPGPGWFGLIELADNNPLVCADVAHLPNPAETLALIAIGPLLKTGLILEPPTLVADLPLNEADLVTALATEGPLEGVTCYEVAPNNPTVRHARATIAVADPDGGGKLLFESAYEEPYNRVLYVRRDESSEWEDRLVANRPWAVYRLTVTPGDGAALVSVAVMADLNGKLGAAQAIHLMNVMDGLEESLGIPEDLLGFV